jgi:hypothetical protein
MITEFACQNSLEERRRGMAVRQAKTKARAKRPVSGRATQKKRLRSQSSKKRSAPGLMTKATEVVQAVIAAASEAVQGAVEAGKEATGIGKKGTKARLPKRS